MMEFVDFAMRSRIDGCLEKVALILDKSRLGVSSPEQVAHQYEDKYLLANHLVNATIACYTNCFEQLGLSQSALATLKQWAENRNVSLCFVKTTTCNFLKEAEIDVQNPTSVHVDGTFGKTIVSVVTKVKEYTYSYKETFTFGAFSGVGDDSTQQLVFYERNSQIEIVTRTAQAPFSESTSVRPDVNIAWLLNNLHSSTFAAAFEIDRLDVNCCTPLQNPDVFSALKFASAVGDFCSLFAKHLTSSYDIQARHGARHACKADINSVNAHGVFNPIVPLFRNPDHLTEEGEGNEASTEQLCLKPATACLQTPEVNQLLHEHRRSLAARCDQMDTLFSASATSGGSTNASARGTQSAAALFTAEEARRIVVLQNVQELSQSLNGSLDFIEQMIRAQLVAAVGKELAVKDFAQYMTFHNRKVFKEEHQPKPFSYAVRRSPAHSPEGQIQIETAAVIPAEPIYTVSQSLDNAAYMEFALNATTTVKFGGERHLHGWMAHRFSGQALPELKLIAQARQFSSYIVLIGRIASAKLFQPKYGFIVQNKDEISIPLELEHIPTAREFKDAISSLSPEQQRFAKAFRSMQLESTLFGVCVIQIKPQLEKVLKLQADSLTKEIKLTQDLMQLFTKYQISPDLLTYDEALSTTATTAAQSAGNCRAEASATEKLLAVKKHVQALQEMLMCTKEVLVADRNQQREYRGLGAPCGSGGGFTSFYSSNGLGEINRTPVAPSGFGFGAAPAPDRSAFGTTQPAGSFGGFGAAPQPAGNFGAPTNFGGFGAAPQPAGNFGAPTNFGGFGATTATAVATSSSNFGAAHAYTGGFGGFCAAPSTISSASAHASYGAFQSQQQPSQQQKAAPTPASVVETSNVSARADHSVSHASASQSQETERIPQQVHRAAYDTAPVSLGDAGEEEEQQVDYTKYPDLLEGMYTKYDPETSLRPTIINPGSSWTKRSQESLMAAHTSKTLGADQQAQGKNAAFDLLDALTRSGALPVEYASLHVIIAATHCFDQSLMDTVVKRNVNPIERVERSTLIMAAALNNLPPGLLINENHVERVTTFSPQLFDPCLLAN